MKYIYAILFFQLTLVTAISQESRYADYYCVNNQDMLTERLVENKKALAKGMAFTREKIYVPIKFHLVADDDGAGRVDIEDMLDQLCDLNSEFSETGFEFYLDDGFNFIDNTQAYEAPTLGAGVAEMLRARRSAGQAALNVFVTLNARQGNVENGTVLGFYEIENDWIVIRRNQIGNSNNTLSHEIGHYFSLKHPHSGWEQDPWEEDRHGNPVLINRVNGVQIELVDGSNCETAGDQLCDTPPDYNFGLAWDNRCPPFNLNVQDRNRDTIIPQQNNFMSYFIGCDPYVFSPDQSNLMMAEYNSQRKSYIRTGFTPNQANIVNTLELVSPDNNTTSAAYNGVLLQWTSVANASTYFVKVKSGQQEIIRFTDKTEIYITEMLPNKTYTWSVTPYNERNTCANKKTNILKTNDVTTATVDPTFIETIHVYPNPVNKGENLSLTIESNQTLDGILNVYSITGSRVHQRAQHIKTGHNQITLDLNHIKSGLYMLSLTTTEGNIERKIIIK